jgi:AraC family L-rhamnose operon regulatory protein RhaS
LHWLILDVGVRHPRQSWHWPSWMVLTKDDLDELTRKLRHNENPVWNATLSIQQSFRDLARTVETWNQPHGVSRLAADLNLLFVGILDALSEQQIQETPDLTSLQRKVELFLQDMENNREMCGEMWTIESMAELVNMAPMKFLNKCRLDRAAQQLRENTGRSITDIALACGFNSSQYFATRFRRRFKISPSQFVSELDHPSPQYGP